MMYAKFALDITVEGKPFKAGDVVPASEVPAGCLEVLQRQLRVTLVNTPAPPQPSPAPVVPDEPKQAQKRK